MSRDVISVTEETLIADIAILLETNRIKRVPVLRDGKLVGIVSRANLVRALAMTVNEPANGAEADDRAIRDKLLAERRRKKGGGLALQHHREGRSRPFMVVFLLRTGKRALVVAATNIPGVQRNEDHMPPVPTYLV